MSSMSWVKMREAPVAFKVAAICARFWLILRIVFASVYGSSFSTLPTACPSIASSPSRYFAPQPPVFFQQIQPPPNSARPFVIASTSHSGQRRRASRQRYRFSLLLHDPIASAAVWPVALTISLQRIL